MAARVRDGHQYQAGRRISRNRAMPGPDTDQQHDAGRDGVRETHRMTTRRAGPDQRDRGPSQGASARHIGDMMLPGEQRAGRHQQQPRAQRNTRRTAAERTQGRPEDHAIRDVQGGALVERTVDQVEPGVQRVPRRGHRRAHEREPGREDRKDECSGDGCREQAPADGAQRFAGRRHEEHQREDQPGGRIRNDRPWNEPNRRIGTERKAAHGRQTLGQQIGKRVAQPEGEPVQRQLEQACTRAGSTASGARQTSLW